MSKELAMKSNKVKVFEFIKEYSITQSTDEYPKLTTQYLSEKLDMKRTNLSRSCTGESH